MDKKEKEERPEEEDFIPKDTAYNLTSIWNKRNKEGSTLSPFNFNNQEKPQSPSIFEQQRKEDGEASMEYKLEDVWKHHAEQNKEIKEIIQKNYDKQKAQWRREALEKRVTNQIRIRADVLKKILYHSLLFGGITGKFRMVAFNLSCFSQSSIFSTVYRAKRI